MIQGVVGSLASAIVLLLSLTALFGLFLRRINHQSQTAKAMMMGAVFGIFGVINLTYAFELLPGVVIDLRSPLVIVAGLYGGGVGAFVAAGMIVLYRFFIVGGAGALGGSLTILSVAIYAAYAHRYLKRPQARTWFLLGLGAVPISVFWGVITLSPEISQLFLRNFVPAAIILYPLLTLLLGSLVAQEYDYLNAVKELNINEQRFRAIFDESVQFVGVLRPDGVIVEANQTTLKFAGIVAADVIGKYYWQAPWWSQSTESQMQIKQSVEQAAAGQFVRYRAQVVGHNKEVITVDFSLTPIFDQQGQVILLIPEGRNITPELVAEERRIALSVEKHRNEVLRDFITDAAHHLRTPVTILRTSNHLLAKSLETAHQHLRILQDTVDTADLDQMRDELAQLDSIMIRCDKRKDKLAQNIDMLQVLIEDLLELSRLDQADTVRMQSLNITDVFNAAGATSKDVIEQAGLQFKFTPLQTPIYITGDEAKLQLVLQNLIENALHYTPRDGCIELLCDTDEHSITLKVSDTGIGIPVADQAKIFTRFFRTANARTHSSSGTGLGLAIVHKIIERHNGTITLQSEVGQGTTFTVTLPRQQPSSQ